MESYTGQALVVTEGPKQGASYPLQSTLVTLGRATDNTIVLDSANVSRYHAQIRLLPGGARIEDLGSTNGTWVNNHRLHDLQSLMPGDTIRLADYVTFRYTVTRQTDDASNIDPGSQRQPTQWPDEEPEHDPSRSRVYDDPSYGESHAPTASPRSVYRPPHPMDKEEPVRNEGPKWLYAVIVLLIILLCLCVATAVYIWFAPREFWEWLFNLFNISLPNACSCWSYFG